MSTPGPRGPLRGRGIEAATEFAMAVTRMGEGPRGVDEGAWRSDAYPYRLSILPRRAELRYAPVDWLDVGGDASLLDGGAELRLGLPTTLARALPMHLAAGVRQRFPLFPGPPEPTEPSGEGSTSPLRSRYVRLEAYPLLWSPGGENASELRLLLAAGVHSGLFEHLFILPQTNPEKEGGFEVWHLSRFERRLEAAFGVDFAPEPQPTQGGPAGAARPLLTIFVQPYVALARDHDWADSHGVSVVARGALRWDLGAR
jgi:hypothetical protein